MFRSIVSKILALILLSLPVAAQTQTNWNTQIKNVPWIDAAQHNVKQDLKYATDAGFTNTSGAVVLSANDPQFVSTDLGKTCWGTNYIGGTGGYTAGLVVKMATGTITLVTDGRHATCSQPSTFTGTGTFIWTTDDTTALLALDALAFSPATGKCSPVFFGGIAGTTSGLFNTSTCITNYPSTGDATVAIKGASFRNAGFGIIPTFNFSHATSCKGPHGGCFFSVAGLNIEDISIFGFGWCNTGVPANTRIIELGVDSYALNMDIQFFGCQDTNLDGWYGTTQGQFAYNINSNGGGAVGIHAGAGGNGGFITQASFFCCGVSSAARIDANAVLTDFRSGFGGSGCGGGVIDNSGTVYLFNSLTVQKCTAGNGATIETENGAISWLDNIFEYSTVNGAQQVFTPGTGVVHISRSAMFATGVSGGSQCLSVATGTIFDGGGNSCTGGVGNVVGASAKVYGDGSITGVADVAGNHVLTSGWGTANVNTLTGTTTAVTFIISITGGAPGSGPVLTDTFASPFLNVPSGGCTLTQIGGTFAEITNPVPSALTKTGVAWTFSGTPISGHSYTFQRNCRNP